jgi:hypothetical protein
VVWFFARIGEQWSEYEGVENMRLAADQPGDLGEVLFFVGDSDARGVLVISGRWR